MSSEKNPSVVPEEPKIEPGYEELDYTAFLKWDDWSEMIASSGQMTPPWFRQVGLDDGEVLLFSPLPEVCPEGEDKEQYAKRRWTVDGAQIARVCGPTKRTMTAVWEAKDEQSKQAANVKLVAECLTDLPESAVAKRPFMIGDKVLLPKGERLPAPMDFYDDGVLSDNLKAKEVVPIYILNFLPDRIRKMVHTAAVCMAIPEVEFVVLFGKEKGAEKPAQLRPHVPRKAGDDENFSEASSGSSAQS